MNLNKWPSDGVLKILESLKPGDELVVTWRDACGFRDVAFPEEIYLTRKRTRGRFYKIIDDHLILISEETSNPPTFEGTIIPIGVIEEVEVLKRRKRAKRFVKRGGPTHPVKIVYEVVKVGET